MAYRLGIDLGTASIGLVAVQLNKNNQPESILWHSCRIFPEPVDKGTNGGVGEAKKAARRKARLSSKLIDRRALRLRDIASLFKLAKLDKSKIPPDHGQLIHSARAKAVSEKIELADLMRVFLRMAKRRGYSGGFKTKKDSKSDDAVVEPGINKLKENMSAVGCNYIGEYLYHRFKKGETLRLKEVGMYADREMVEDEFEQIWKVQSSFHSELLGIHLDKPLNDIFHNAIFYQRPLKSVSRMVGNCQLETNLPRSPMSQLIAQEFRIEKQIADLRWGMRRDAPKISPEQQEIVRTLLLLNPKQTFKQVYKAFEKAGCPKPENLELNFDRPSRPELKGNTTLKAMQLLDLADEWIALDQGVQISIINFLADLGSPQEVDRDDWHLQYQRKNKILRQFKPEMVNFINRMVSSGKFDRLSKMKFDTGRSSYSIKALRSLVKEMRKGMDEHAAISKLYPQDDNQNKNVDELLKPLKATGNIVVDGAMRQLRYEINRLIEEMGETPTEIVIEMSRDMGLGLKKRGEIEGKINKNRIARERAKKELESHGIATTSTNIFRYRLWEEQSHKCPYCEKRMSLSSETDLEHIVPKSLTRVGRQQDHIILAHRSCNDEKGDLTPWQKWGDGKDPDRWRLVQDRAADLEKKKRFVKARLLTITDYKPEIINSNIIESFTNRQYHESSWIAKLATQWMKTICSDVSVSRGQLTAYLRRIWGLETVIPEVRYESNLAVLDTNKNIITQDTFNLHKSYWEGHYRAKSGAVRTDRMIEKRIDHRHHVIDALVIAMTTRSLFQKMAKNYKQRSEQSREGGRVRMSLAVEPPLKDIRDHALDITRNHHITHKPDRQIGGSIFKKTAYGIVTIEGEKNVTTKPVEKLTLRTELKGLATGSKAKDVIATRKKLEKITPEITKNIVI